MKLPNFTKKTGGVSLRFLLLGIALAFLPLVLMAQAPTWWSQRGVTNNNPGNDYAAVNQGQVKNIATAAVAELNADLPGGAGSTLNQLAITLSSTSAKTNDYAAVNLGQVKAISKPFFDRLLSVGYQGHPLESGTYPWAGREGSANDYAMANIGQVKNLFGFDVSDKTDSDNPLSDWWQMRYFGQLGIDPIADPDGDAYPNIYEFFHQTDPQNSNSKPQPDLIVDQNDGTYRTIQDAINNLSHPYQIIQVNPGVYYEQLTFASYPVLLISASGAATTTISGSGCTPGSVITIANDSVINGFTITSGSADQPDGSPGNGGGIMIQTGSPHFTSCVIRENDASMGAAIYSNGNTPVFLNCTIANNTNNAQNTGQAVVSVSGSLSFINSIVWNPAISAELSGTSLNISYCDVRTNSGTTAAGTGNINADPMLTQDGHLYALGSVLSPCLGAADPSVAPKTDMDGELRNSTPDIGADQFVDSDGNGLPDYWESKYFGQIGVDVNAVATRGDGSTILEDYIQGLDPNDFYNGLPATFSSGFLSGDQQIGTSGSFLSGALMVQVSNSDGALANAPVLFQVATGGLLSTDMVSTGTNSLIVRSDCYGIAQAYLQLTGAPGTVVQVTATPLSQYGSIAVFTEYTDGDLAPPSDLRGTSSPDGFQLSWIDNSYNSIDFVIERSEDGGANWSAIATISCESTTYTDSSVASGIFYVYRVSAEIDIGRSAPSNEISILGTDPEVTDTDGDGLPDAWEARHGLNPRNPADANDDMDRDGYLNIYEYFKNSDLADSSSTPSADFIVDQSGTNGTFTTIQSAINATWADYQIIRVSPGTYFENISISSHNVLLISSGGAATTIINGGAAGTTVTVANDSIINGLTITNGLGDQNGVAGTGGGVLVQGGSPRLTNCVLTSNHAACGAAIYTVGNNPVILNCTIANNGSTTAVGEAIAAASGSLTLCNTIVWNPNSSVEISGSNLAVSYCDVRGVVSGTTNINMDPLLTPDCHLSAGSPCIGGANANVASRTDMDMELRGNTPDIGADQFVDSDGNGLPDYWELKYFGQVGVDPNAIVAASSITNIQAFKSGISPLDTLSPPALPVMRNISGGNQVVAPTITLPAPLTVQIINPQNNLPMANATVGFSVISGGGTLTSSHSVTTNANGYAKAYFSAPPANGTSIVEASLKVGGQMVTTSFLTQSISPGAPSNLTATLLQDKASGSPTGIRLHWQDNSTTETGFIIEEQMSDGSWKPVGEVPANTTNFDINIPAAPTT